MIFIVRAVVWVPKLYSAVLLVLALLLTIIERCLNWFMRFSALWKCMCRGWKWTFFSGYPTFWYVKVTLLTLKMFLWFGKFLILSVRAFKCFYVSACEADKQHLLSYSWYLYGILCWEAEAELVKLVFFSRDLSVMHVRRILLQMSLGGLRPLNSSNVMLVMQCSMFQFSWGLLLRFFSSSLASLIACFFLRRSLCYSIFGAVSFKSLPAHLYTAAKVHAQWCGAHLVVEYTYVTTCTLQK